LELRSAGKYAVYAHIADVVLIDMSAAIADFSKSGDGKIESLACKLLQCKSTVMSVKICETTDGPVVVVGCMESVQIWSCRDGERLTNYTLPNPPIEDDFLTYDRRYYARGAAMVISYTHTQTHTHTHTSPPPQHLQRSCNICNGPATAPPPCETALMYVVACIVFDFRNF
jgi:hypothetical protein